MKPNQMPVTGDLVSWTYSGVTTYAIVESIDADGKAKVSSCDAHGKLYTDRQDLIHADWDFLHSDSAKDQHTHVNVIR